MTPSVTAIKPREEVAVEKRRRMSKWEFAAAFVMQGGTCACGCGEPLVEGQTDEEHTIPNALGGGGAPNALMLRNHHKEKTRADVSRIAKARRQARKSGPQRADKKGRKVKSRGFDKKPRPFRKQPREKI